jgi:hypothetical protein
MRATRDFVPVNVITHLSFLRVNDHLNRAPLYELQHLAAQRGRRF